MKQKVWVLVNTRTGKVVRDNVGGVAFATQKTLKNCFDYVGTQHYLSNPKYEIKRIEIEV